MCFLRMRNVTLVLQTARMGEQSTSIQIFTGHPYKIQVKGEPPQYTYNKLTDHRHRALHAAIDRSFDRSTYQDPPPILPSSGGCSATRMQAPLKTSRVRCVVLERTPQTLDTAQRFHVI